MFRTHWVQMVHGHAMDGRTAEAARTLPQQVVLYRGQTTQGSRIHRFRPWRTGDRHARSHQRGKARMTQISPARNSLHDVEPISFRRMGLRLDRG